MFSDIIGKVLLELLHVFYVEVVQEEVCDIQYGCTPVFLLVYKSS